MRKGSILLDGFLGAIQYIFETIENKNFQALIPSFTTTVVALSELPVAPTPLDVSHKSCDKCLLVRLSW